MKNTPSFTIRHNLPRHTAAVVAVCTLLCGGPGGLAADQPATGNPTGAMGKTKRPHVFVTAEKVDGLRSVSELREAVKSGHAKQFWDEIRVEAEHDLTAEPLLPTSVVPGRPASEAKLANSDWWICHLAGQRVLRASLVQLITGDTAYRDSALRQMEAILDSERWPDWRDQAHRHHKADLRTGMLSQDLAVAYDWLWPCLSDEQRRWIIEGIDRRGIQPFWRAVEAGSGWANGKNNWTTVIVGGLGIAGMALGDDHPDSQRLIDFSLPRMTKYLETYGPAGEFNESVGYAGATRLPVAYFMAYWYATGGSVNRLAQPPFVDTARWYTYFVLPPGRVAAFGDGAAEAPPDLTYFAPLASANRDRVLQWVYVNYPPAGEARNLPWMLLWFDSTIEPASPEDKLAHGRAFSAHGACMSSRTDWSPAATPCVVYGKAAIERYHEHHDAGQVCIDGYGKRLIVDLGSPPGYPPDFFNVNSRYKYYNASSRGHNVLVFGKREMAAKRGRSGRILAAEFDDERGGFWQLDLTGFYDQVKRVRRTVVHLNPAIVAVLDDAKLAKPEEVSLRWHTVDPCEPDSEGGFRLTAGDVCLAARILRLDAAGIDYSRGEHEYRAPYNRHRLGVLLEQRHESYVEAVLRDDRCRLLSLFAIFPPEAARRTWEQADDGWAIETPEGPVSIRVHSGALEVANRRSGTVWRVPVGEFPR